MGSLAPIEFEWVDTDQRLAELCEQWQQQSVIALDTEFIRTRTFFPKIGLLQIADNQGVYLVDPLEIEDTQPLKTVWQNTNVIKVIHSCSEDLSVFEHYLSALPTPLFDTQIAAAFAGYGASIGYANLIHHIKDEVIPKEETRSDWLQRPLSQSQLNYAALDVVHLLEVYDMLTSQLSQKQRLPWVELECQQLLDKIAQEELGQYYLRVKSAWKLQSHQLAVLQQLCHWREQEVRQLDIPRNRLIKDATLLEMAQRLPENNKQLRRVRDIYPNFIEQYGAHCLQLIQQVLDDPSTYPQRLSSPLTLDQRTLFKSLKEISVEIAESLNIPPEFLARKKDIEALVRSAQGSLIELPGSLKGWRQDVIGQPLLNYLSSNTK